MAPRAPRKRTGNRLIDSLPSREIEQLESQWQVISLKLTEEICRQDRPLSHVHFPVSGIYSTVIRMADGRVVEASTVGKEGMIGLSAVLGLTFSHKTATTPVPGDCLRLAVPSLRPLLQTGNALGALLRRYAAFALRNAYQAAACNSVHSAQERTCRWLLTNDDRVGNGLLAMTHEFLAQLIGVRRQTVTVIVGVLQAAGFISSRRGMVRIVNRPGLEAACCECYRVSQALYEQIVQVAPI